MIPKLFISYSHRDERWYESLVRNLRILERNEVLRIWSANDMKPGDKWTSEILEHLAAADIAVILVSPDALASDYIVEVELPAMLRRQRAGELVIVPILLRPSLWTSVREFAELQFINVGSKSLSEMSDSEREDAFSVITKRIASLALAIAELEGQASRSKDNSAGESHANKIKRYVLFLMQEKMAISRS